MLFGSAVVVTAAMMATWQELLLMAVMLLGRQVLRITVGKRGMTIWEHLAVGRSGGRSRLPSVENVPVSRSGLGARVGSHRLECGCCEEQTRV